MLYPVHLVWVGFELTTLVVIGTDLHVGSCKSNYNMIMTMMAQPVGETIYIYYRFSLLHKFSLVLQPWMSEYIWKTDRVYISVAQKQ